MESRREFLKNASLYATPFIVTIAVRPSFAAGTYEVPGDGPVDGPVDGPGDGPVDGPGDDGGGGPVTPAQDPPDGGGVGTQSIDGGESPSRGGSSDNWWERFVDQIEEI